MPIFIELHQFGKRILFNVDNILYVEEKETCAFLCMTYVDGDPMIEEVQETYTQVIEAIVKETNGCH